MTQMRAVWKGLGFFLTLMNIDLAETDALVRHHRSSKHSGFTPSSPSDESLQSLSDILVTVKRPICQPNWSCHYSAKSYGYSKDLIFSMCECPEDSPCGAGPKIRNNNVDYYVSPRIENDQNPHFRCAADIRRFVGANTIKLQWL